MLDLMDGVFVHHLRLEVCAREIASFGAQPGSALRGALYSALASQYCPDRQTVHLPGHQSVCPVCRLLAAEDPTGERGRDLPRPLTIEPPSGNLSVEAGQAWRFGLSLIAAVASTEREELYRECQKDERPRHAGVSPPSGGMLQKHSLA